VLLQLPLFLLTTSRNIIGREPPCLIPLLASLLTSCLCLQIMLLVLLC
jgi:hypothetical protein